MKALSEIQSILDRKEKRFRHPILKFTSSPRHLNDPPSELDSNDGPTARFIEYRMHDLPSLYTRTVQLLPIGDKVADHRREKLLEDIDRYTRQAVAAELRA